MRRGVSSKVVVKPPPQAWLANCLHPTRVVTVSSAIKAAEALGPYEAKDPVGGSGAGEGKAPKEGRGGGGGERGTKRGRGEGSGAKYEVTDKDGFIWVQCDDCSKWCVQQNSSLVIFRAFILKRSVARVGGKKHKLSWNLSQAQEGEREIKKHIWRLNRTRDYRSPLSSCRRYAPETCVDKSKPDAKWKVRFLPQKQTPGKKKNLDWCPTPLLTHTHQGGAPRRLL